MAASITQRVLIIPRHNFRYLWKSSGCNALRNCCQVHKYTFNGYRYLSSSRVLQNRQKQGVAGEATFDSSDDISKVEDFDSQPSKNRRKSKFEALQARMREKYNLPNTEQLRVQGHDLSHDNTFRGMSMKQNTQNLENDDYTEDFFGVLSEDTEANTRSKTNQRLVKNRTFEDVAQQHPYLTGGKQHKYVKVYETSYGYMTLDSDAKYTKSSAQKQEEEQPEGQSYIDEQFLGDMDEYEPMSDKKKEPVSGLHDVPTGKAFIEDQYFAPSADTHYPPWENGSVDQSDQSGIPESAEPITSAEPFPHTPTPASDHSVSSKALTTDTNYELSNNVVVDSPAPTTHRSRDPPSAPKSSKVIADNSESQTDIFEEQYFGSPEDQTRNLSNTHKRSRHLTTLVDTLNSPKFSGVATNETAPQKDIFEEQYFGSLEDPARNVIDRSETIGNVSRFHDKEVTFARDTIDESRGRIESDSDTIYIERATKLEEKLSSFKKTAEPNSAYTEAMKIRQDLKGKRETDPVEANAVHPRLQKWRGEKDSKGFRKLKNQVLNLHDHPEEVVLNILKDSILFENEEMLALYKPYGLPSHGGPGVHHSVGKLLPKLAQKIDKNLKDLYIVHRLDKETTGVMVVAKSEDVAWKLHDMFKKRQVFKKYWVLTKGVPSPTEGVIDIPMGETEVGRYHRMNLRPDYTKDTKLYMTTANKVKKKEAVTNYKVLATNNSVALVECIPETGVKHQIRCHLAFGLNTPILGDHKYSHTSKVAPQKLFPVILERLGIRQATVRYLPMHLHAKALMLPEMLDGRNVFISARLPKYFNQNMKWLGIKIPD